MQKKDIRFWKRFWTLPWIFENSRMYPGIPEYFDNQGRGLYAYLTGAASWYMLTMITEVFGVRGDLGDLVIAPALMPEQYNENGQASLTMEFAGRKLEICICNPEKKLPSEYKIKTVWCDEKEMKNEQSTCVRIDRELLEKLSSKRNTQDQSGTDVTEIGYT